MFNNLIESSSHKGEFKRRGSFVLFTAATYVLLFAVAGVASIYAYDARLDYQNTEIIAMLSPLDFPAPAVKVIRDASPPKAAGTSKPTEVVRQNLIASVNRPDLAPPTTSVKPNVSLPVPDTGHYRLGDHDSGPIVPEGNGRPGTTGNGDGNNEGSLNIDVGTPPPLPPTPAVKPPPKVISKGVITGLALDLPKPTYSAISRQAHAQGAVSVQVLIDETGKVVSAKAVSGHPLLQPAATQAAYRARFSPTRLGDQPVKVSGVITYNFVLQ
jgi:TonB family protein